jgi:hypothetical protein
MWVFGLWLERVNPLDNVLCDLPDYQGVSIHPRKPFAVIIAGRLT